MTWQALVGLVIMAATAGLSTALTQYPADKVPHWIPIALAVLAAVGGAVKVGLTGGPKVDK